MRAWNSESSGTLRDLRVTSAYAEEAREISSSSHFIAGHPVFRNLGGEYEEGPRGWRHGFVIPVTVAWAHSTLRSFNKLCTRSINESSNLWRRCLEPDVPQNPQLSLKRRTVGGRAHRNRLLIRTMRRGEPILHLG